MARMFASAQDKQGKPLRTGVTNLMFLFVLLSNSVTHEMELFNFYFFPGKERQIKTRGWPWNAQIHPGNLNTNGGIVSVSCGESSVCC